MDHTPEIIIDDAFEEVMDFADGTTPPSIRGKESDIRGVLWDMYKKVYKYAQSKVEGQLSNTIEKYATDEEKEFLEGCGAFHPKKKKKKKKKVKKDK